MQDIDITSTQSLIDRYYEEEKAQREMEQTLASVTTRLDASDLAMLSIISKRFRKTREEVAQEILSSALVDLFARVDASERKLMARDADDAAKSIANEIAEENGVHSIEFKGGAWGNHDRAVTKLERKKAKQDEEAEANFEKAVAERVAAAVAAEQSEPQAADETAEVEETSQYAETAAIDKTPAAVETQVEEDSQATAAEMADEKSEAPASMFAG
ncbi:MAG: hypothetical protein MK185_01580 [Saccharospirillaceae bacterium]|nr:hypothetical protein [Saccharospirillaceae bacterium]